MTLGEDDSGASRRNDLSGTVNGLSIQANVISGPVFIGDRSVHDHVLALLEEFADVKRKLVESMAADREITKFVWFLQDVLATLRIESGRLVWELSQERDASERLRAELTCAVRKVIVAGRARMSPRWDHGQADTSAVLLTIVPASTRK
ncbi:hypothetical protein ACQPYE_26700 [Actinosynnema sp. CA-299493]